MHQVDAYKQAKSQTVAPRTPKQIRELAPSDLKAYPCWELIAAKAGEENKGDERFVRPVVSLSEATQQVLLQASFHFPNGRVRSGIVSLDEGADPSAHQPANFVPGGLLRFYVGASRPTALETKEFVHRLERVSLSPLPVRYASTLRSRTGKPLAAGVLTGLYWWHNCPWGELRVEV